MKQRLLILAAATSVLFAACNGGGTEGSYTQEQLDSITKMKTDSAQNAFKLQNDSLINAQAAAEARTADSLRVIDSVFNAGNKSGTTKTTIKKTTKPAKGGGTVKEEVEIKEEVKETIGNGKPKAGTQNSSNTIGNGKPKAGTQNSNNTIGNGKPRAGTQNQEN